MADPLDILFNKYRQIAGHNAHVINVVKRLYIVQADFLDDCHSVLRTVEKISGMVNFSVQHFQVKLESFFCHQNAGFTQRMDQSGALFLIVSAANRLSGGNNALSASGGERVIGITVHLFNKVFEILLADRGNVIGGRKIHYDTDQFNPAIFPASCQRLELSRIAAPCFDVLIAAFRDFFHPLFP